MSSAGSDWNTFSAVMTVQTEHVVAGQTVGREQMFNIKRQYQRDGAWHTVLEPVAQGNSIGAKERRRRVAHVETGPDGNRSYDGDGKEIVDPGYRPSASPKGGYGHLELPASSAVPGGGATAKSHRAESRLGWADRMLADRASGERARALYARMFAGSPSQDATGLHYARVRGDQQLQLVADTITGVPLEVTATRGGTLEYHIVYRYERQAGGRTILRETRFERPEGSAGGLAVVRTHFDKVKFNREGGGL